jgi:hypothetical protein
MMVDDSRLSRWLTSERILMIRFFLAILFAAAIIEIHLIEEERQSNVDKELINAP